MWRFSVDYDTYVSERFNLVYVQKTFQDIV